MQEKRLLSRVADAIQFTIKTTSSSKVLKLGNFTAPYRAEVHWGDGKYSRITSNTTISHTYSGAGTFKVAILGRLGGFWNKSTRLTGYSLVTSLDLISSESLTTLNHTFRSCTALKTIPAKISATNLKSCNYTFYNCKSITSAFTELWNTHKNATHTSCFTNSYYTLYSQYGSKCSNRNTVIEPDVTYWDYYYTSCEYYNTKTGTGTHYSMYGGPTRCSSYWPGPGNTISFKNYKSGSEYNDSITIANVCQRTSGLSISPTGGRNFNERTGLYTGTCSGNYSYTGGYNYKNYSAEENRSKVRNAVVCNSSNCTRKVTVNQCNYYQGSCKRNECGMIYYVGGYITNCTKLKSDCKISSCPYAAYNQSSVDAAKKAGWL